MPDISVIIPVYNTEKYLKRCVDSIRTQSFSDIEIILIDDGSTDSSPMICDEYANKDSRIKVVHQKNGGVSNARNHGLSLARGKYIHFSDSDDFVGQDFYRDLYNLALLYDADVCCSAYLQESKDGKFISNSTVDELIKLTRDEALSALFANKRVSYSTCDKLFKNSATSGITFNERISHNEDYLFCYEIIKRTHNVVYTSKAYYHYCYNSSSAVRSAFSHKRMTAIDVQEYVLNDISVNFKNLYKGARTQFYKVVLFTRKQMEEANYFQSEDIKRLERIIRTNLLFIIFSNLAHGYKFLALKYTLIHGQ